MKRSIWVAAFLCLAVAVSCCVPQVFAEGERPGYSDTPLIPGFKYRVHDKDRPYPVVVTPGTESSQEKQGTAPSDAVVLFDGKDLSKWTGKDGVAKWKVENGYMEIVPGTGDIQTRDEFGDSQVHVEWASPVVAAGDGQSRGNSGVFLLGRYEIQILDSYGTATYSDGEAGALYGQYPPLVNACRKPGEWQSFDIVWRSPRFEGDKLLQPARVTMFHNGVLVHNDTPVVGPTGHRTLNPYQPHPTTGPLKLQDHGHLVRYRNIWYRPVTGYDGATD